MSPRITRRRRNAKIFLALLFVAGLVLGAWWWFVLRDPYSRLHPPKPISQELHKFQEARPLMGTEATVVVYAPDEATAGKAITEAFARGEEINRICSDYDPESELSKLSSAPLNTPVRVSPTLAAVLAHARVTAEITDGAYDPTLGPLTRLWRASRKNKTLPPPDALAAARAAAGWQHLEVDPVKGYVILKTDGMRLDLGGIAKGFAADEMMDILFRHGIRSAFIAVAGDIRLSNPPPGRIGWRVGIKTLGHNLTEYITIANCAVSTSGDLQQYVEIDGTRYSHIIDPSTGLGLTRRIAATVVAPTAVQTDPFATFCCINPEAALRAFEAGQISCRVVSVLRGRTLDRATGNFPRVDAL